MIHLIDLSTVIGFLLVLATKMIHLIDLSTVIGFLLPSSLPARSTTRYQRLQEITTRCVSWRCVSLSHGKRRQSLVWSLYTILRHKVCNILRNRLWQNETR